MKKILVPTDFSANANVALQYAGRLASKADAEIIIMHCGEFYQEKYARHKDLIREHNQKVVTDLFDKLNELKRDIEKTHTIKATVCVYKDGDVATSVLKAAVDHMADLIVIGTYGITGLRRKLFGSKAAEIINISVIPVISVPPTYLWSPPVNIALAIDDTLKEIDIVNPVFELADLFEGKVSVVVFSEETEAFEVITHAKTIQFVQQNLKSAFKKAKIDFVHLTGPDFQHSLQQFVSEKNMNMLAMITQQRGFFQNIFDSSVTQKMSYYTTVPLLSLHKENEQI